MFSKILYPTDFSEEAIKALAYVKKLRQSGGREVIVLHVINQRIIDGLMRIAMTDTDIDKWRAKAEDVARESIEEIKRELEKLGFHVTTVVRTGYPGTEILDVEGKEAPTIIVIGSHGRTNLGDMVLGSVSRQVIRKCKGPVMVIKRDAGE